jgi:hypothetical protein
MNKIKTIGLFYCKECEQDKPLMNFYKLDPANNDVIVLFNTCDSCRLLKTTLESKQCSICNETKLLNHFYKTNKSGTTHRKECQECYYNKFKKAPKGMKYKENSVVSAKTLDYDSPEEYRRSYYKSYYQKKKQEAISTN